MKLAETNYDNKETGCCARLDEARWEGQAFEWKDKPFVKDHIWEFLHVPLNFGSVMARDQAVIEQAQAYADQITALLGDACRKSDILYSSRILKKTGLRISEGHP